MNKMKNKQYYYVRTVPNSIKKFEIAEVKISINKFVIAEVKISINKFVIAEVKISINKFVIAEVKIDTLNAHSIYLGLFTLTMLGTDILIKKKWD
jgi:hypothetical protein